MVLRRWVSVVRTHRRLGPHRLLIGRAIRRWVAAARCVWMLRARAVALRLAAWRQWMMVAREAARRAFLSFRLAEVQAPTLSRLRLEARVRSLSSPP